MLYNLKAHDQLGEHKGCLVYKGGGTGFFDGIAVEDKTIKFYGSGHFLSTGFIDDAMKGINIEQVLKH